MKAQTKPYFILQEVLSAAILKESGSHACEIVRTDDFVASQYLAGSSQPLEHIFSLLLPGLLQSGSGGYVTARPLLQTGTDVLLEFSIAHRKQKGEQISKEHTAPAPAFITAAETAIKDLGGRSERIQLSGAGGGLKFILKWCWLPPQEIRLIDKSAPCFTGRRILIAEDNDVNAKGLSDLIGNLELEVDAAVDGKGAIDLLTRKGAYDLLVMDLDMPHMDGLEATRFIRKKLKSDIPIIGLSAGSFSKVEMSYENTGLNHCISKSSACQALHGLLSRFLGNTNNVASRDKARQPLVAQWGEHGLAEAHKHALVSHQHGPSF